MGIVSRIGKWLDTRFPEKISTYDVMRSLEGYQSIKGEILQLTLELVNVRQRLDAFETGARSFDKDLKTVVDEMNKAKAVLAVMNRTRTAPIMNTSEAWKR